jgi:hypothetical protein
LGFLHGILLAYYALFPSCFRDLPKGRRVVGMFFVF